jgi:L-alanine-DL-glutamate epimerase-like enolase superfamily enzyme
LGARDEGGEKVKITKVESRIVTIPVETPYVTSYGSLTAFSNVLVWISTDEGIVGIGESAFVGGGPVREETPESTKAVIDLYLAPAVLGSNPFDIELVHEKLDRVVPRNLVAKTGIDLALWDIMGKTLDLPVYKLLGGTYREKIPVTYTLSMDSPERMAEQASLRKSEGYTTVVIKIGHDPAGDLERLRLVRDAVGSEIKIRLDANEGYRPDQAIRVIRKMERFEPEFVEEPVKRWDLAGMARVTRAVDTPISSDESNSTLESAMKLIEQRAVDILNIKVAKNGGLLNCKKIAALAEAYGVPCLVGGDNTYEITRQACRHLATSTPSVQRGLGSEGCGPASQSKIGDVAKTVVTYQDVTRLGGFVVATPGPGLGVEIDDEAIQRFGVP